MYALPPFLKKINETDITDNLLLPNHHVILKNTLIGRGSRQKKLVFSN